MRDADETIERLLAGLRDVEPSSGIERRILEGMEARQAAAASDSLWRRLISPSLLRPAIGLSLVCAVASLIVAITVHQSRHAPAEVRIHATRADARQAKGLETVAHKAPVASRRMASRVLVRRPRDVSAVGETEVASFPAPPSPLTEQERLLLRLAHRRDPKDTAILNPAVQAAQSAKATEQFQQFFEIKPAEMRSEIE
jgi:hypothetical protein